MGDHILRRMLAVLGLCMVPGAAIAQDRDHQITQTPGYYLGLDGVAVGPLSLEALEPLAQDGRLTSDTLVWFGGLEDWQRADAIADLAPLLEPGSANSPLLAATYLFGRWKTTDTSVSPNWGPMENDLVQTFGPDGTLTMTGTVTYLDPPWEQVVSPFVTQVKIGGTWSLVNATETTLYVDQAQSIVQTSSQYDGELASEDNLSMRLTIIDDNSFHDGSVTWLRLN